MSDIDILELAETMSKSVRASYDHFMGRLSTEALLEVLSERDKVLDKHGISDTLGKDLADLLIANGIFYDTYSRILDSSVIYSTYIGRINRLSSVYGKPCYDCSIRTETLDGVDYIESVMNIRPNIITEKADFILINRTLIASTFQDIQSEIPETEGAARQSDKKAPYDVLWEFADSCDSANAATESFIRSFISSQGKHNIDILDALIRYNLV